MFGLITPNFQTLNQDEKSRYQAIYCGLCHSLKDNYSNISRLAMSYDLTFLVLLLSSLYEPDEKSENCNCLFHPGNKYETAQNKYSDYCADITVALAYHKILDDISDEGKFKAKLGQGALRKQYKKVCNKMPEICNVIEEQMLEIHKLEKYAESASVGDEISKCFGLIMANIFTPNKDNWCENLAKIGANMGRLIYFMDAAIDFEKDIANKQFNPYKLLWANENSISAQKAEQIKNNLSIFAGDATQNFEKLPLNQDVHLLQNILYEGLWINFNHQLLNQN